MYGFSHSIKNRIVWIFIAVLVLLDGYLITFQLLGSIDFLSKFGKVTVYFLVDFIILSFWFKKFRGWIKDFEPIFLLLGIALAVLPILISLEDIRQEKAESIQKIMRLTQIENALNQEHAKDIIDDTEYRWLSWDRYSPEIYREQWNQLLPILNNQCINIYVSVVNQMSHGNYIHDWIMGIENNLTTINDPKIGYFNESNLYKHKVQLAEASCTIERLLRVATTICLGLSINPNRIESSDIRCQAHHAEWKKCETGSIKNKNDDYYCEITEEK